MSEKKLIIFAVVASLLLIVAGFVYGDLKKDQPENNNPNENNNGVQEISGIIIGDPNAPLTVQEYTSFLCPACQKFATETFPELEKNYIQTGKINMEIFVYPPLELGQAALCAEEQGKFKAYHNYLFEHQNEITSAEVLAGFAKNAGLEEESFRECFESGKHLERATAWYNQGVENQIEGTPTFFIGDKEGRISGAYPYNVIKELIEAKLN